MQYFAEISATALSWLLLASLLTSLISTVAGFGGGILLLLVMASIVEPISLIAVHGLVQMGAVAWRVWLFKHEVSLVFCRRFVLGSVAGVLVFYQISDFLSPSFLQVSIGLFVLITTWLPTVFTLKGTRLQIMTTGSGVTVLALCVGGVGPALAAILRGLGFSKGAFVATISACFFWVNLLKVGVYGALGFSFAEWMPFVVLMVILGALGVWAGRRLLGLLNEQLFSHLLKLLLTGLAVRILWQGLAL
ncbi:MAG: TSUP family transporter [Motiliproteus sp.]